MNDSRTDTILKVAISLSLFILLLTMGLAATAFANGESKQVTDDRHEVVIDEFSTDGVPRAKPGTIRPGGR